MTASNETSSSVETRYLGEGIALLRQELRELRDEVRSNNAARASHTDLTALNNLWAEKFNGLVSRNDNQMASLERKTDTLGRKLDELREDHQEELDKHKKEFKGEVENHKKELKAEREERQKYVKHFWTAVITGVVMFGFTNAPLVLQLLAQGTAP